MTPHADFSRVRRLLCVGAHSDDIEIGCGATLLRLLDERPDVDVTWLVLCGADADRRSEAEAAATRFLGQARHRATVRVHTFRDAYLPQQWADVKGVFESLKPFSPDLILTHRDDDAHQDHRVCAELAWNTFRSHAIWQYEIPKYDADLGRPNAYVTASPQRLAAKCRHLQESFASQRSRSWFDDETFRGLARLRGVECQSPSGYAEAFHVRKWVL